MWIKTKLAKISVIRGRKKLAEISEISGKEKEMKSAKIRVISGSKKKGN